MIRETFAIAGKKTAPLQQARCHVLKVNFTQTLFFFAADSECDISAPRSIYWVKLFLSVFLPVVGTKQVQHKDMDSEVSNFDI